MFEKVLLLKEQMNAFAKKNEGIIKPILKFIVLFFTILCINKMFSNYEGLFTNMLIITLISIIGMFLSRNGILILQVCIMAIEMQSMSIWLSIIMVLSYLILTIYHLKFYPKQYLVVLLLPTFYGLGIPYAVLFIAGLFCNISTIITIAFSVVVIFFINNASSTVAIDVTTGGSGVISNTTAYFTDLFFKDARLTFTIIVFVVIFLSVYTVSRLSIEYSWYISIVVGGIVSMLLLIIGEFLYDFKLELGKVIFAIIMSCIIAAIFRFFMGAIDYSRIEHVQFEDDDYYYYVKAVPKINIAVPEKSVKKINVQRMHLKKKTDKNIKET